MLILCQFYYNPFHPEYSAYYDLLRSRFILLLPGFLN